MPAEFFINGLVNGCADAIIALGFALIYNTTRVFHAAYGAIYGLAAYLFVVLHITLHWGLAVSLTASLLLIGSFGAVFDRVVYLPLERRKASKLVVLISSLGAYIVLTNAIAILWGPQPQVLSISPEKVYHPFAITITGSQSALVVSVLVVVPAILIVLRSSHLGKIARAMRDNPVLTSLMGVDLLRPRFGLFALGSAVGGLAAILCGFDAGVDPNVGMPSLLIAATAVVIGGIDTFEGPVLGGLGLGLLQSLVVWKTSARWAEPLTYLLLVFFLVFRPQGLIGRRRRIEEAPA